MQSVAGKMRAWASGAVNHCAPRCCGKQQRRHRRATARWIQHSSDSRGRQRQPRANSAPTATARALRQRALRLRHALRACQARRPRQPRPADQPGRAYDALQLMRCATGPLCTAHGVGAGPPLARVGAVGVSTRVARRRRREGHRCQSAASARPNGPPGTTALPDGRPRRACRVRSPVEAGRRRPRVSPIVAPVAILTARAGMARSRGGSKVCVLTGATVRGANARLPCEAEWT
jgi:hypothetical protein